MTCQAVPGIFGQVLMKTCQVHARYLPGEAEARKKGVEKDWRPSESQATILRYQDVSRIYVNCHNCQYVLGSHQAVQMQPA